MADKIFVNGFISNDVPATAPDFILGKGAFHVPSLLKWLNENQNLADEKGYINITTMRSKTTGKRYTEVDTYKKAKPVDDTPEQAVPTTGGYEFPSIDYDEGEAKPGDIPF